jgi:chromosome segregation ATPase
MPVLGTRHHESVFGSFTGKVRTAHDVVPVEVEKDQEFFQHTVDRVDNVVSTLGQQNQKLSKDNTDLKRHLQLTLNRLEEDDAEIGQCHKEMDKHLADLDTARKCNEDLTNEVKKEKADHEATKKVLMRVQKELDAEVAALAEARTKIIKDLEDRNARLIEEARTERNSSTSLAQRLAASERRANDLQLKVDKLTNQLEEMTADNSQLLQEKEDMKETLARERASFEEALAEDRRAAQRQLDAIAGSLQARLHEQTQMYSNAVEEMRIFKMHAHTTADEYKAFVDAQNDDIVRLKELAVAQAAEIERLFDSEMATRMKLEHIEDTIYLTEDQVGLAQGRSPIRQEQSTSTTRRTTVAR